MAGVNNAKDYYTLMGFGHEDPETGAVVVDNTILQGGIISVYYLGTLVGALGGGKFSDMYGRIKSIALGALIAIFGASLQCSAQNHSWMICARLINGFGTGILNAIVPVYATETADYTSRGQFVAVEFTLNIFGVVVAYWLEFGCSKYQGGTGQFTWRFPIAFQIAPLILLFVVCWAFPESPRWLTKVGRGDEARYILGRLRGEGGADEGKAQAEYEDIENVVQLEKDTASEQHYYKMLFGIGSGKLHTGRRVQLVIWLQIMQEWIGIAGVTIYSPTVSPLTCFIRSLLTLNRSSESLAFQMSKSAGLQVSTRSLTCFPPSSVCSLLTALADDGHYTGVRSHKASPCSWLEASANLQKIPATSRLAMQLLRWCSCSR